MFIHPAVLANKPHLGDMTEYPFVVRGPDGNMLRTKMRYVKASRYFQSRWAKITFRMGWHCFYTGAHLYGYDRHYSQHPSKIPWGLSLDHLVPKRHKRFFDPDIQEQIHRSVILSGMRVNYLLGHDPLVVRAVLRKELHKLDLNRDDPSPKDVDLCYHAIVEVKDRIMRTDDGAGFVWQDGNFEDEDRKRQARTCFAEMLDIERTFLQMPYDEQMDWLETFEWKW